VDKGKEVCLEELRGDFMKVITAVLIDTVSIQRYIFSSNRLKENLGASHLVKHIYDEQMKITIRDMFGKKAEKEFSDWKKCPEKVKIIDENAKFEVEYIGGGNALLLFREDKAKEFIKNWTKSLLIETPGLQTAVAISDDFNLDNFKHGLERLFKQLTQNKNKFFPDTTLSKYGITADCSLSGLSGDIYYQDIDMDRYISSVSYAKLKAAKSAQYEIQSKYADILKDKYGFTTQIDQLGQMKGEKSYIAVVHIDGNQMGKRFISCEDLPSLRKLSISVQEATDNSFKELIRYIVINMPFFIDKNNSFEIVKEDGKYILPIRPIIIGGDDITFVCDGRLGVHFAEKFIEFFSKQSVSDKEPLSACAGVSITKTKYPFYRGYLLAEELCTEAKKCAKKEKDSSWLDFHIAYGGFSGTLLEIREKHYKVKEGELHFGPYRLSNNKPDDEKNIINLKKGIKYLTKWPRSKLKEMRSVLTLSWEATKKFIEEMKARGLKLPNIEGGTDYTINGWENAKTPYFDMIELMEMYPEYFLR